MKKIIKCFATLAIGFVVLSPLNANADSVQIGYKSFIYEKSGSSFTSTTDGNTAWVSTAVSYTWTNQLKTSTKSASGNFGYANAEILIPDTWRGTFTKGTHKVGTWIGYSNASR